MKKRWWLLVCTFCFVFMVWSAHQVPAAEDEQNIPDIEAGIYEINKYGNLILTISPETMQAYGYEPADLISVKIGDTEVEMPIGTNYSDVDNGDPVCRFVFNPEGTNAVVLAVHNGNLAEEMSVARRHTIDTEPGYEWTYINGLDDSVSVYISMSKKQGYASEYAMHQVTAARTNDRGDYTGLSDEEYANFRAIETTGMGTGTLFRSSSPIDPALNRNQEADDALLTAGIRTVINMADSETSMKRYADYNLSNYAGCDIIALDMDMDYNAEEFRQKLTEGFCYIASHDGPYLIHCKEGKDRTGFAAAVLECLMGADVEEIVMDYMLTYRNYYGIEPETPQYREIAADNIEASMEEIFHGASIRDDKTDLKTCAELYLKEIGMSEEEITALKNKLSQDYGGIE